MQIVEVSLIAPFVCAVANMVLGMVWYNPATPVGKMWMKESGHKMESMTEKQKKMMGFSYLIAFVCAYTMAYVLGHVLAFAETASYGEALQGAFWMWLGFVATVGTGVVLWEGKSWKLWAINTGYYLVAMLIMSTILFGMGL
ncbi:MAG: DUF1761 domain-containing protein [Patescibacteria group bacterium]